MKKTTKIDTAVAIILHVLDAEVASLTPEERVSVFDAIEQEIERRLGGCVGGPPR